MREARRRDGPLALALLALALAAAAGCAASAIRYHYPRLGGEVYLALDRLDLTIEIAEAEGGGGEPCRVAAAASKGLREALDPPRFDERAMAAKLGVGARSLERAADLAWQRIAREPSGAERDRLYDLANQARRAAGAAHALERELAGRVEEG